MEFIRHESGGLEVAELSGDSWRLSSTQDALDLIAESQARSIIVHHRHVAPEFFRLGSGLAGAVLQKFTNYRVRFAIVGGFSAYPGKPLRDFIRESNSTGWTVFAGSVEEAIRLFRRGS